MGCLLKPVRIIIEWVCVRGQKNTGWQIPSNVRFHFVMCGANVVEVDSFVVGGLF